MKILYLQNNHPHLNWWILASLPILQIDMDILVFGWLCLNREMSIYLNLSLYAGILFYSFWTVDPTVPLLFLKCFKFE